MLHFLPVQAPGIEVADEGLMGVTLQETSVGGNDETGIEAVNEGLMGVTLQETSTGWSDEARHGEEKKGDPK